MENDAVSGAILSQELLEAQLGQVDLLMAMYPVEGSVVVSDFSTSTLRCLREALGEDSLSKVPPNLGDIDLVLELEIPQEEDEVSRRTAQLSITIPLHHQQHITEDAPPARIRLQQPPWMSKAEVSNLMDELPQDDDLFASIENVTAAVSSHLSHTQTQEKASTTTTPSPAAPTESLTRVWFYFPSISTRAKRDDLVQHAPSYGLTGFLLAGKPGILCVEGGPQAVDAYMRFIKTESWGDIPAHHKKVSERYRQPGLEARAFAGMQEITGALARRGERANRNDMRALEAWLAERGLGDALIKVLI